LAYPSPHSTIGRAYAVSLRLLVNLFEGDSMKIRSLALLASLMALALPAAAADLAGRWTAEFESPIGVQKYVYEFTKTGDTVTGEATFERSIGNGKAALKNVKVEGDKISFEEPLSVEGNELTITYSGTLAGDELKLERKVGDFGTEQLTAKRAAAPAAPPAAKK
jgi:hypothetical protein